MIKKKIADLNDGADSADGEFTLESTTYNTSLILRSKNNLRNHPQSL